MSTSAKTRSPAGFLFLLLCAFGCDHAWSRIASPHELSNTAPAMHNEADDGIEDPIAHDDVSPDGCSKAPVYLCCSCNGRSCGKQCPEP